MHLKIRMFFFQRKNAAFAVQVMATNTTTESTTATTVEGSDPFYDDEVFSHENTEVTHNHGG